MDPTALGHNLRRLRDARKLTQLALAERADLSRVAYGSIEAGAVKPRVDTLMRLAAVLEVRLEDLLAPARILKAVRFRALKRMTSREQLLVDVSRWLSTYTELEVLLDDRVPYVFRKVPRRITSKPKGRTRARVAAAHARDVLGLREGERIRDICGLLQERAGVKVYPLRVASDSFFGLSVGGEDGGPAVVVNVWDRISVERWIFTAAHELGHLLLHLHAYDVARTEESPPEEKEADQFASQFLMPDSVFWNEWNEASGLSFVDRVMKVKRIFNVSYRTVLYRLSEDQAYGGRVWGQFQAMFQDATGQALLRTEEPDALPASDFSPTMVESHAAGEPRRLLPDDFVEDRLRRLVRRGIHEGALTVGRAAQALDLDLHEMRKLIASWVG